MKSLAEKLIEHRDVTGVLLHFSREHVASLIEAMPPEQRRFSRIVAETIKQPHEIWQSWGADETSQGKWNKVRTYLRFLDLSVAGIEAEFGVAVVKFVNRSRWELQELGIEIGKQDDIAERINSTIRTGSLEYSNEEGGKEMDSEQRRELTPSDEKALALNYAMTALIKTLVDAEVIDRDHLFSNLAGARKQLERIGEDGAAELLAAMNESWLRI